MSCEAIKLKGVTKRYRTGQRSFSFFREVVQEGIRSALGKNHHYYKNRINALENVSLTVQKGERVALIGQNGSGKSTCLKVIAGVTKPTNGMVTVDGTIGSLIEVTVGFQPELTGKANLYLNACIQGLSHKETKERYADMVAFSGLGNLNGQDWMDTPVKWYSSGMFVRLGFSIAAFLNPDILIVDEALAYGDAEFQEKSLKRMSELMDRGATLMYVTHSLESAKSVCKRGIVLEHGKIVMDSDIETAAKFYGKMQKQGDCRNG